jgi:hypothetical protein
MRQDTMKVADDHPIDNVGSDKRLSQQIWSAVLYLITLIPRLCTPSCSFHTAPRDPVLTEYWISWRSTVRETPYSRSVLRQKRLTWSTVGKRWEQRPSCQHREAALQYL